MDVFVFHPRKIDPPRFVAEQYHDLPAKIGEEIGAEQCDNCGNSLYRIEARGPADRPTAATHFVAVCVTDEDRLAGSDDPEVEFTGCGAEYRIRMCDEKFVVF